jgi:hypothetical protein
MGELIIGITQCEIISKQLISIFGLKPPETKELPYLTGPGAPVKALSRLTFAFR